MNNYDYYNYDWYRNNNSYNNTNLFSPEEGFEKGNLFSNIYEQYKNYKPRKVIPKTERDELLYELDVYTFAAHDLNLYLDLYPNDKSILMLFNDYQDKIKMIKENYETKYGPLTVNNIKSDNKFIWQSDKWPWEGEM